MRRAAQTKGSCSCPHICPRNTYRKGASENDASTLNKRLGAHIRTTEIKWAVGECVSARASYNTLDPLILILFHFYFLQLCVASLSLSLSAGISQTWGKTLPVKRERRLQGRAERKSSPSLTEAIKF